MALCTTARLSFQRSHEAGLATLVLPQDKLKHCCTFSSPFDVSLDYVTYMSSSWCCHGAIKHEMCNCFNRKSSTTFLLKQLHISCLIVSIHIPCLFCEQNSSLYVPRLGLIYHTTISSGPLPPQTQPMRNN